MHNPKKNQESTLQSELEKLRKMKTSTLKRKLEELQHQNLLAELEVNELLKTRGSGLMPGLHPFSSQTDDVYEKAMYYYLPNRSSDLNHLNRFHDYLQFANPVRAFSVLANLYFDYGAMNPGDPDPINGDEDRDEFGLLVKLFADLAVAEHDYIRNEREDLLREMYGHNDLD